MGCSEAKENLPTIICIFEEGNETQKQYCLKLKDNFRHEKKTKYSISSSTQLTFSVKFKNNENLYDIQNTFDNSEVAMNKALEQMYEILNKN